MILIINKTGMRSVALVAAEQYGEGHFFIPLTSLPHDAIGIEIMPDCLPELAKRYGGEAGLVNKTGITTVLLPGFDSVNKIPIIKHIREFTGLGLRESKEIADCASHKNEPVVVSECFSCEEALKFRKEMKKYGAKVDLKLHDHDETEEEDGDYHGSTT